MIPPRSTIGILGGGQLGRMLGVAAAKLGYRTHIYAPESSGPATEVAAEWTQGRFEDAQAMRAFAGAIDVATYEFENIDPKAVAYLAGRVAVHPPVGALEIARYRPAEKSLVAELGGATARWRPVHDLASLKAALGEIGAPAILKTTLFGYDGKGQVRIEEEGAADTAWDMLGRPHASDGHVPAILEQRIDFFAEFSVILCRAADGRMVTWDTPENVHKDGILDRSIVPARDRVLAQGPQAIALAERVAERLGHVGVLTCEFFATENGPLFNEMAPRVHNSGHWTIEGAVTSQFENHIRAICGLPLGSPARVGRRVEMENLIGDDADRWAEILREPAAHLHLYGKTVREGRKMGHVTRLG